MNEKVWRLLMLPLVFLVLLNLGSGATLQGVQIDSCTNSTYILSDGVSYGMQVNSNCAIPVGVEAQKSVEVEWIDPITLSLGELQSGDIESGDNWFYVDSILRPDLDQPALLKFKNHGFVTKPDVLRNGVECTTCNVTFRPKEVDVLVEGFSNYSLTGAQDFIVYSDDEPELKDKTYQTIDLGAAYRADVNFSCVVQIFGLNDNSDWILVQTNPERQVQAKLLGNPDQNQPESLGYFPVKNGMANTYFRGKELAGYNDFTLVIQCASPTTLLVYEESISTRYTPLGRNVVGRGVWFTDGANAFYAVIYLLGGLIVLWIVILVFRRTFRRY